MIEPQSNMPTSPRPAAPTADGRLFVARWIAVATLAVLVGRIYFIQFSRGEELRTQAAANRFVPRDIEADRGVIYDAAGRQVVLNKPRFMVDIVTAALPKEPGELNRVLGTVAQALDMPLHPEVVPLRRTGKVAAGLEAAAVAQAERRALSDVLPYTDDGALIRTWQAVPVARNVPRQAAFQLMEAGWDLPGVSVEEAPVREYPAGPTLAHILGFTGSIPSTELADYTRRGYAIYDIVGRSGLEATYENMLRGAKGEKMIEVDAAGRELRVVGQPAPPLAGDSLVLALDLDFQRQVEDILQAALESLGARTGAVVAIDPRNGAVKALVSLPTFDNNMFSTGASPGEFAALLEDSDRPLLNRSISGLYPPGSTFKMITAAAALQEGVVDPGTRIVCPGMIVIPNQYDPAVTYPFVCWNRGGHGAVNTVEAIAQSCDVYFYEVSGGYHEYGANQPGLGSERLGHYARLFGLGEPTGIELLGEATGRVPSPDWLSDTQGMVWTTGRTYQMGIGQSDTLVTPLQLASVTAAVANGGHLLEPHLVDKVVDPNGAVVERPGGEIRTLPVDPSYLAVVREGMRGAVTHGTALASWSKLPTEIAVAGKTGTAEFCDPVVTNHGVFCRYTKDGNLLTHAWFVAFAPYDDPEIALAVFIDGSGLDHVIEGSQVAAPVAADVLRAYFHLPAPQPPSADCADCPEAAGAVSPSTAPPVAPTECAGCADAVPAATQTLP